MTKHQIQEVCRYLYLQRSVVSNKLAGSVRRDSVGVKFLQSELDIIDSLVDALLAELPSSGQGGSQ